MKEFVVVKKWTTYFTQTVLAENLDEAVKIAETEGFDWDFYEEEQEVYGSEAI